MNSLTNNGFIPEEHLARKVAQKNAKYQQNTHRGPVETSATSKGDGVSGCNTLLWQGEPRDHGISLVCLDRGYESYTGIVALHAKHETFSTHRFWRLNNLF